jgi:hypothetical protein
MQPRQRQREAIETLKRRFEMAQLRPFSPAV